MQPIIKDGHFHILRGAGCPEEEIEKFIGQFVNYLVTDHDDYPDAAARVHPYLGARSYERIAEQVAEEGVPSMDSEGNFTIPIAALMNLIEGVENEGADEDTVGLRGTSPLPIERSSDVDGFERMRRMLSGPAALILVCALALGCSVPPPPIFKPYRGCVTDEYGRTRPGTVVGESRDEGGRYFIVQLDEYPADGRHFLEVRRIKRNCEPQGRVTAERAGGVR
jgi:hypothetical protein